MKIRSLGNTSFDLIFETFNRTFAAYDTLHIVSNNKILRVPSFMWRFSIIWWMLMISCFSMDFKVVLLLSNYQEAILLYPWCSLRHNYRSKSSTF